MTMSELRTQNTDKLLSFNLQNFWETIINKRDFNASYDTLTLEQGLSNTFVCNFYGLLSNEYNIPQAFLYPNLRLNGFNSSTEYDGRPTIKIYDAVILDKYYDLYKIEEKVKRNNNI